jgi:MoaA/NifB/PqqE/SkfB family radical SAM enzyme
MLGLPLRKIQTLGVDVVHGCQLRCIGCPNSSLKPDIRHMPPADFAACLGNLDVRAVKLFRLFNYGEPMLHPDLPGLLVIIPRQRYRIRQVEISTNAQVHRFDMLAEVFKTGVLDTLVVSCDGDGTPGEYERLRPPARWDRLLQFLARSRELRDAYSPATRLMTRTICETPQGRRRWSDVLGPLGYVPEFRGWLYLSDAVGAPCGPPLPAENGMCVFLQQRTLFVDYDGTVVTCCCHPRAGMLGNLKESTYSQILAGPLRRRFLHRLETNRKAMPICGTCGIRRHEHKLEQIFRWPYRWLSRTLRVKYTSANGALAQ